MRRSGDNRILIPVQVDKGQISKKNMDEDINKNGISTERTNEEMASSIIETIKERKFIKAIIMNNKESSDVKGK